MQAIRHEFFNARSITCVNRNAASINVKTALKRAENDVDGKIPLVVRTRESLTRCTGRRKKFRNS